jgi:hypothetical protein
LGVLFSMGARPRGRDPERHKDGEQPG